MSGRYAADDRAIKSGHGIQFFALAAFSVARKMSTADGGLPIEAAREPRAVRRLDVIVPSYNRPARLYHLLQTGLGLAIPGMFFVVIDDGSTLAEEIPGRGILTTEQVCKDFRSERIVYLRNPENVGVAASWERYYQGFCSADYTMSVTDKDEFISAAPVIRALDKLDADLKLSMVVLPMRQKDRETEDRPIIPNYSRLTGREYLACYARDTALQHCSMWGVIRVAAIRAAGVPRSMGLRHYGLDDGFGIDVDFVFMVAATGDVDFEAEPHVRRSTLAGGTERSPLTFAYTYYQYAKRAMRELEGRGVVDRGTVCKYLGWWQLLICRGLIVAHRPVHGTESKNETIRIRRHLRWPILVYLPLESLRYGIKPTPEAIHTFLLAVRIVVGDRMRLWKGRLMSVLNLTA